MVSFDLYFFFQLRESGDEIQGKLKTNLVFSTSSEPTMHRIIILKNKFLQITWGFYNPLWGKEKLSGNKMNEKRKKKKQYNKANENLLN